MAIRDIFILTARGSTLVVRIGPRAVLVSPNSAGIDFRRQKLMSADVDVCRRQIRTIPALKELEYF